MSLFEQKATRLTVLSDCLSGRPSEIDAAEAEELLRAGNIDPQELKARFHQRFDILAREYAAKGRRLPPLLKQALADLRPGLRSSRKERELAREARSSIRRIIEQVRRIPVLLEKAPILTFASAYRKKKGLSERDKKILEEVAQDLGKPSKDRKTGRRARGGA